MHALLAGLIAMTFAATLSAQGIVPLPPAPQPVPPAPPPPPPLVKVGDAMPDFTLPYLEPDPNGGRPQQKQVKLSDYKGKQAVVLAFFPAAFSPG